MRASARFGCRERADCGRASTCRRGTRLCHLAQVYRPRSPAARYPSGRPSSLIIRPVVFEKDAHSRRASDDGARSPSSRERPLDRRGGPADRTGGASRQAPSLGRGKNSRWTAGCAGDIQQAGLGGYPGITESQTMPVSSQRDLGVGRLTQQIRSESDRPRHVVIRDHDRHFRGYAKSVETGYWRLGGHAVGSCSGAALLPMGPVIRRRFLSLLGWRDELCDECG